VGHPQGVFGVFSYHQLVMLFPNMICLTVALAAIQMKSPFSPFETSVSEETPRKI
jgi:hypothetical protein